MVQTVCQEYIAELEQIVAETGKGGNQTLGARNATRAVG
ncbi:hypothetical protein FB596_1494 [Sphingobium sp. AEW013]|nr:hypothetical protein FB596_1494 [Sphingobium sp. AEW013]TWD19673.1 hypothetical protein FB594_1496 [Sphingobium sp. AEW001]